jgi:hypothetical protein
MMKKIAISFELNLDVDYLRAKYEADIKFNDRISEISAVLLKQLDLMVTGDFYGAYNLTRDWGAHEMSFMDPVTNEVMNKIRHNTTRNHGLIYNIQEVK